MDEYTSIYNSKMTHDTCRDLPCSEMTHHHKIENAGRKRSSIWNVPHMSHKGPNILYTEVSFCCLRTISRTTKE